MRFHKIEKGRWSINRVIFELSRANDMKAIGLMIKFENWEITLDFGLIFGRLWISIPHHFLFKVFPDVFHGKNFGEWGREIGLIATSKYIEYSIWWYSNINKPHHPWRNKWIFIGKKGI